MEIYMYSYYLNKGIDLDKLINLSTLEKYFYIASMEQHRQEEIEKNSIL